VVTWGTKAVLSWRISNTDQGSQYTRHIHTQTLKYKKPMSFYYDSLKINNKDYRKLVKIGA